MKFKNSCTNPNCTPLNLCDDCITSAILPNLQNTSSDDEHICTDSCQNIDYNTCDCEHNTCEKVKYCCIQGPKGDRGDTGAKGDKGDTGLQGIQGLQGVKGDTGLQGVRGDIGAKGEQGEKGDTGIQGVQGVKGDKGDTGLQGIQGLQGVKGDQGLQGSKGDKGDTGLQGLQGIQGAKGDTGLQGSKGDKGDTGSRGDTGATGPQGPAGPQGAQGATGPKGDSGACCCTPGPTGAQGPQGSAGAKGEQGEQGSAGSSVCPCEIIMGKTVDFLLENGFTFDATINSSADETYSSTSEDSATIYNTWAVEFNETYIIPLCKLEAIYLSFTTEQEKDTFVSLFSTILNQSLSCCHSCGVCDICPDNLAVDQYLNIIDMPETCAYEYYLSGSCDCVDSECNVIAQTIDICSFVNSTGQKLRGIIERKNVDEYVITKIGTSKQFLLEDVATKTIEATGLSSVLVSYEQDGAFKVALICLEDVTVLGFEEE